MKNKFAIALVALLLGNFPALPSHAEMCEGNFCQVSFSLTEQIEQFNVPLGVTSIEFEIAGGSGGRGGQGGKVTGTLTNLPETLYVVVGGQGDIGSQAAGGYNGGGKAGGFRTNEGSGGGASDIRLDLGLDSRIVVAGGGGGAGGFSGAPGGAGGGETGGWGQSGQGTGGGPGTQISGGNAGISNGGSFATAGSFGVGGNGGNSMNAGGGGGGGGWYGGGGGGSDDDNCCSDGGGGGGGSSYAHPEYTENILHQQGVQLGHGYVTLSYTKSLVVTNFTAVQLDSNTAVFDLGLSLPTDLSLANFDLAALYCGDTNFETTDQGIRIVATGCEDGEQQIKITPGALDGTSPGVEMLATVNFDATAPQFVWQPGVMDHQQNQILIPYSLDEGVLSSEQLGILGCDDVLITETEIVLQSCLADEASMSVPIEAFADSFGNTSPREVLTQSFVFDRTAPNAELANLLVNPETADHSFQITFSEPVSFDVSRISVEPSGCEPSVELLENSLSVSASCGFGRWTYVLPALSAADLAGNLGPVSDLVAVVEISEPESEQIVPLEPEAPIDSAPPVTGEPQSDQETPPQSANEEVTNPEPQAPAQEQGPVSLPPAPVAIEPTPSAEEPLFENPEPAIESEESAAEESTSTVNDVIESSSELDAERESEPVAEGDVDAPALEPAPVEVQVDDTESTGFDAVTVTTTSQPRLASDPLASGPNLNLLLITAGGFGVLATTGYLIYRKMMVR